MVRITMPKCGVLLARPLFGAALVLGAVTGGAALYAPAAAAKAAAAPKTDFTKAFVTAAAPIQKTFGEVPQRADVRALQKQIEDAKNPAQQTALRQQVDGLLGGLTAQVNAASAAATTPDDKMAAGNFVLNLGIIMRDPSLQEQGLSAMAATGRVSAEMAPKINFNLGQLEYFSKKYSAAREHLQLAQQGGYSDPNLDRLLVDAYYREGNPQGGLQELRRAVDRLTAAKQPVPSRYYLVGVAGAEKLKDLNAIADWGGQYAAAEKTPAAWSDVLMTLAVDARYQRSEMLDVLRLMFRANALSDYRAYHEYVDDADSRSLPAEVARVLRQGVAAGKLDSKDSYVVERLPEATSRIASDRASLPGLSAQARSSATGVIALATADAYLAHADLPKAVELYRLALSKGGIDRDRAQTRLGIALSDSGDLAGARSAFGQVGGIRQPLAKMWLAYLSTKSS